MKPARETKSHLFEMLDELKDIVAFVLMDEKDCFFTDYPSALPKTFAEPDTSDTSDKSANGGQSPSVAET